MLISAVRDFRTTFLFVDGEEGGADVSAEGETE